MSATVINYDRQMARWEPDSRGRLAQAALALYEERGFESTTVAEIAERAGLTERTFFRHFSDKREVLFAGSAEFERSLADPVAAAPDGTPPLDAVAAGLRAVAAMLESRRDFSRQRQRVIDANRELQERELIKLASLTAALTETLRGRGVAEPTANLAAEAGLAAFRVAFERWGEEGNRETLPRLVEESLAGLKSVAAG